MFQGQIGSHFGAFTRRPIFSSYQFMPFTKLIRPSVWADKEV